MSKRTGIVSALWILTLVNYLDRVAMSFAGPALMKSLSISPAALGIILSSFGVGYMLSQIPGGLLADRFGAKTLLVVGPVFWAIFTGATGLVSAVAGFVIVRVCFGLSEGFSQPAVYKSVGENFEPRQRARVMSISGTAIALAPVAAGTLVGALIVAYGWRQMFMIMMWPALAVAVINYLLIPGHRRQAAVQHAADERHASFRSLLGGRSLWLLSFAAFSWNIPYWAYLGWMPSYLALARHIDLKSIGPLASIPYVFAFIGMLLGGWLGGGLLHRRCPQLIVACFMGAGASLFAAYNAHSLVMSLAALSSAAFFLFGAQGPVAKTALDLAPERFRAGYVGVYNTAGQFGGLVAPAAIGFLVSATGTFAAGFGLMIAGLVVASCLLLALTVSVGRNTMAPDSALSPRYL